MSLSLLNSIIGPVMRGPSSSHAAAPYFIGRCCRQLSCGFGEQLLSAEVRFDPTGTFAPVYQNQGSDQGFAAGLSGLEMTAADYADILPARLLGKEFALSFAIEPLTEMSHPNRVDLILELDEAPGVRRADHYKAISTGGGMFEIFALNGTPLLLTGSAPVVLAKGVLADAPLPFSGQLARDHTGGYHQVTCPELPPIAALEQWKSEAGLTDLRVCAATQAAMIGAVPPLASAADALALAGKTGNLFTAALSYESRLLGVHAADMQALFAERCARMLQSVADGFSDQKDNQRMKYMPPTASRVKAATLAPSLGGEMLQAATAGALAVMERNAVRGIVAAAPTAGSAGIIPGVLYGLKQSGFSDDKLAEALAVMALIGTVYGERATFAAECGGCQVETGAAAAMAAGGITYLHGGTPEAAFNAATMVLMNTLGLICDPVGGEIEIPCLARNIAGVSHAFSSAMAITAGFQAVLKFDDLVDATLEVGSRMHSDFRCTARGGCAATKTAQELVSA